MEGWRLWHCPPPVVLPPPLCLFGLCAVGPSSQSRGACTLRVHAHGAQLCNRAWIMNLASVTCCARSIVTHGAQRDVKVHAPRSSETPALRRESQPVHTSNYRIAHLLSSPQLLLVNPFFNTINPPTIFRMINVQNPCQPTTLAANSSEDKTLPY